MTYATSDFTLATTLVHLKKKLTGVDRTNPRKAEFLFEETPDLLETVDKFFNRELMVEPQTFGGDLNSMKNRLYNN